MDDLDSLFSTVVFTTGGAKITLGRDHAKSCVGDGLGDLPAKTDHLHSHRLGVCLGRFDDDVAAQKRFRESRNGASGEHRAGRLGDVLGNVAENATSLADRHRADALMDVSSDTNTAAQGQV